MTEFLWGAATSSHQVEGGNCHNDWWHWENLGKIETGEVSGAAADHWNRYREDLELAASLGLSSYRFSIEWSRLQPSEDHWDGAALDWYERLIDECERLNLIPMVTLHHFTLPQWLAERGGLCAEEGVELFAEYVRVVARRLAKRVPLWVTVNEPMTLAIGSYLGGFMPPGELRPALVATASRNLFRWHIAAHDILHREGAEREGKWSDRPLQVGIAHNMMDFRPARNWNVVELLLARIFRRFYNRSWLDAICGKKQHFGLRGLIGYPALVREGLGRKTADFIGVNYYTKCYVHWGAWRSQPKKDVLYGDAGWLALGVQLAKADEPQSDLGWALHPAGMGRMLRFVRRYKLPIFVTENGIADARDCYRAEFIKTHLAEVARARSQGIDVRGYYYWSLLDNFEWCKGFPPRFGLVEIDYSTFERRLRPSALVFRDLIRDFQAEDGVQRPDTANRLHSNEIPNYSAT